MALAENYFQAPELTPSLAKETGVISFNKFELEHQEREAANNTLASETEYASARYEWQEANRRYGEALKEYIVSLDVKLFLDSLVRTGTYDDVVKQGFVGKIGPALCAVVEARAALEIATADKNHQQDIWNSVRKSLNLELKNSIQSGVVLVDNAVTTGEGALS